MGGAVLVTRPSCLTVTSVSADCAAALEVTIQARNMTIDLGDDFFWPSTCSIVSGGRHYCSVSASPSDSEEGNLCFDVVRMTSSFNGYTLDASVHGGVDFTTFWSHVHLWTSDSTRSIARVPMFTPGILRPIISMGIRGIWYSFCY